MSLIRLDENTIETLLQTLILVELVFLNRISTQNQIISFQEMLL